MKSPEYLSEQATLAQLLRDSIRLGEGAPAMADRILRSDWLQDRILRDVEKLTGRRFAYLTLGGKRIGVPGEIFDQPTPSGTASGVITLPTDNPKDAA